MPRAGARLRMSEASTYISEVDERSGTAWAVDTSCEGPLPRQACFSEVRRQRWSPVNLGRDAKHSVGSAPRDAMRVPLEIQVGTCPSCCRRTGQGRSAFRRSACAVTRNDSSEAVHTGGPPVQLRASEGPSQRKVSV